MKTKTHWLAQINPQVHTFWFGPWPQGTLESTRFLFDYEWVYFAQGVCRLWIKDQAKLMRPGSFALIPPGVAHKTLAVEGPVFRYCIHFDWIPGTRPRRSLFSLKPLKKSQIKRPRLLPKTLPLWGQVADRTGVRAALAQFETAMQKPEASGPLLARVHLLEVLTRALAPKTRAQPQVRREMQLAYKIKALLDALPPQEESLQKRLATLGYTYAHLSRVFKAAMGCSPNTYLNTLRIEQAKELLTQTHGQVSEIAYEVGFSDLGYFGRVFKKGTRMTPLAYRKKFSR